jgi:hypothetical protein
MVIFCNCSCFCSGSAALQARSRRMIQWAALQHLLRDLRTREENGTSTLIFLQARFPSAHEQRACSVLSSAAVAHPRHAHTLANGRWTVVAETTFQLQNHFPVSELLNWTAGLRRCLYFS